MGHQAFAYQRLAAGRTCLALCHTNPTQQRIDKQAVIGNAVGYAARIVIEEVGGDNLAIVVGGVGEIATAIDLADRPDAGHVGTQLIIHPDEAALIDLDVGQLDAEVMGVGR